MAVKKKSRERGSKSRKGADSSVDARRWVQHELYGKLPLIRHSSTSRDGQVHEWWKYDRTYTPRLPRGAVPGEVTRQVFCTAHHVPKYFYVDETRTCIQCSDRFTFSGAEQKYWYETRKFNFSSLPVRCPKCRRLRRSEHALREQIARAKLAAKTSPDDPSAQLAVARAIVEYHERTGAGQLAEAVAAARRAMSLWPDSPDASL